MAGWFGNCLLERYGLGACVTIRRDPVQTATGSKYFLLDYSHIKRVVT